MATTVLAVILGIILVTAIRPGSSAVKGEATRSKGWANLGIWKQRDLGPAGWYIANA